MGDVFERAINPAWTSAYWYKNVEVPAIMVKTGIAKMSNYIDQDALIAASTHEHVATQHMENRIAGHDSGSSGDYGPPTKKPKPNPKPNPKAAPTNPKAGKMEPRKIANGVYISNNAGIGLCGGFQKGTCTQQKNGRCANNAHKSHQRNKCLHNSHGGVGCDAVSGVSKTPRGGKAGKGERMGRGRGRGGIRERRGSMGQEQEQEEGAGRGRRSRRSRRSRASRSSRRSKRSRSGGRSRRSRRSKRIWGCSRVAIG